MSAQPAHLPDCLGLLLPPQTIPHRSNPFCRHRSRQGRHGGDHHIQVRLHHTHLRLRHLRLPEGLRCPNLSTSTDLDGLGGVFDHAS